MEMNAALVAVGDEIMRRLESRQFETARPLLECMIGSGQAPGMMFVAYAVCLAELGEAKRADAVRELIHSLCDAQLEALLASAEVFLPGGRHERSEREARQNDAEKWLPRIRKKSTRRVRKVKGQR
jgi:hypothetical protein